MGTIPASENEFPQVLFAEGAAPATPATGLVVCYAKSDGLLYCKDDAGVETAYAAAGTDLAAHIADTADAHDASAVSVLDTAAVFTATDVEAALKELYDSIAGGGIPASIVDAKGDLIAATAADTVARVAVGANGTVITAASGATPGLQWSLPPGYELDYVTKTSNTTVSGTSEGAATTIITSTSLSYDGTAVMVAVSFPELQIANTGDILVIADLYVDSTMLGRLSITALEPHTDGRIPYFASYRHTPSAGTHTYTLKAWKSGGGTSSVAFAASTGGTGADVAGFIRVTKV